MVGNTTHKRRYLNFLSEDPLEHKRAENTLLHRPNTTVAVGKLLRHVRKASHCGSKQQ